MKTPFAGLVIVALAGLTGCNQGTPGGPGATGENPTFGQADDTFNLSVPITTTSLQQGAQTEASVGITRAKNFDEDVSLEFTDVPSGVAIEPLRPVIKHGDTDTKIRFKADDEARLGSFQVKITGHPTKGSDAKVEFKLSIAAKDTFTLSTPLLSTSLKQGETQSVAIGINRDTTFDQDVALSFSDLPEGVTIEPASPFIKHDDADARLTVTAAENASLGNFAIKVVGHSAKGADALNEFKLDVVKE